MAESGFPFYSTGGDRLYTQSAWTDYFSGIVSNGVAASGLAVAASTGMNVTVAAGHAYINGYHYYNSSSLTLTLDASDAVLDRIDRIVVRWSSTNRTITAEILKGTPGASPTAPSLTQTSTTYEISLATIEVDAAVTEIVTGDITDNRVRSTTYLGEYITAPLTVYVGSGGDYSTINAALAALTAMRPTYATTAVRATLSLVAGFEQAEQVIVDGIDLSWITIVGADAETSIDRSALTDTIEYSAYPAFSAFNGGKLPVIGQLFSMDTSGTNTGRYGCLVHGAGSALRVLSGCGFKNCGAVGVRTAQGASAVVSSGVFTGCGTYGLYASYCSNITAHGVTATGNTTANVLSTYGSMLSATGATMTGGGSYGARATNGGILCVQGSNCQKGGSPDSSDISVLTGSIITANGATGGLSQTANTITTNGLIIQ